MWLSGTSATQLAIQVSSPQPQSIVNTVQVETKRGDVPDVLRVSYHISLKQTAPRNASPGWGYRQSHKASHCNCRTPVKLVASLPLVRITLNCILKRLSLKALSNLCEVAWFSLEVGMQLPKWQQMLHIILSMHIYAGKISWKDKISPSSGRTIQF